jgi:hypothetical protein
MRFEYAPGATPIDLDEAKGLIPAHLTLQRELARGMSVANRPQKHDKALLTPAKLPQSPGAPF